MKDEYTSQLSYKQVLDLAHDFIETSSNANSAMEAIVGLLKSNFSHYSWVGFYLVEPDGRSLKVGPYRGDPTPHVQIPIDKGICGAAVREGNTIIVPDVNSDPRFLACSIKTKSEIVTPIKRTKKIYGEIDVDSDELNAFGEEDKKLLEAIAIKIADLLQRQELS